MGSGIWWVDNLDTADEGNYEHNFVYDLCREYKIKEATFTVYENGNGDINFTWETTPSPQTAHGFFTESFCLAQDGEALFYYGSYTTNDITQIQLGSIDWSKVRGRWMFFNLEEDSGG